MIKVNENQVYFNKKINRFCQIRKSIENGWECSSAEYYSDAKTTICTAPFSDEYIKENLILVENVEDFADYDGVGWSVRENESKEEAMKEHLEANCEEERMDSIAINEDNDYE